MLTDGFVTYPHLECPPHAAVLYDADSPVVGSKSSLVDSL